MSPEQIREDRSVNHRSDIYSLGMTVYEILTGKRPFDQSTSDYEICKKIIAGDFIPLQRQQKEIPRELAKIVMQAIEVDPRKRFQNIKEMQEAIKAFEKAQRRSTSVRTDNDDETISISAYKRIFKKKYPQKQNFKAHLQLRKHKKPIAAGFILFLAMAVSMLAHYFINDDARLPGIVTASQYVAPPIIDNSFPTNQIDDKTTTEVQTSLITPLNVSKLIVDLTHLSSTEALLVKINEYKEALLIRVGKERDFDNINDCYVFIVDNEQILECYKHNEGIFQNLRSNEILTNLNDIHLGKTSIWLADHSE